MKVSELTYEYLQSLGLGRAHIHTDCTDGLRLFDCEFQFERAKADLMLAYGDVDIRVNPSADWYSKIMIEDEKWKKDHAEYVNTKQEWCRKHGSE